MRFPKDPDTCGRGLGDFVLKRTGVIPVSFNAIQSNLFCEDVCRMSHKIVPCLFDYYVGAVDSISLFLYSCIGQA